MGSRHSESRSEHDEVDSIDEESSGHAQLRRSAENTAKDFYLLNDSVPRGIFNENYADSTQRLDQGRNQANDLSCITRMPPPYQRTFRAKRKSSTRPRQPPLPHRKAGLAGRATNRGQSSAIPQALMASRERRKKIILNSMSVARATVSSKQRKKEVKQSCMQRLFSSPRAGCSNSVLSQSVMTRVSRMKEHRSLETKSNRKNKNKSNTASRSKTVLSNQRMHSNPRTGLNLVRSRGS